MATSELGFDFDYELDTRGLNCPLPVLRVKNSINKLENGKVMKIVTTDRGSIADLTAYCRQTGNELLESNEVNGEFVFLIKKCAVKSK